MSTISVVIPTRNRAASLRACLDALTAQTFADFEVIVVDDASDVSAVTAIGPELAQRLNLRVLVNEQQRGPSGARNRGVAAAGGQFIAFVDDDVRVVPTFLESHLTAHRASRVPLATIGPLAAPADWQAQPWTRWEADTLQKQYDKMQAGAYQATWRQFHTGNALVERAAILDAGAFDEQFRRAEDIELALRMARNGLQFTFLPHAIGWHYSARTLDAWLAAARAYGEFDRQLDQMYPQMRWLLRVHYELGRRHPLLRALRTVTGSGALRPLAARASAHLAAVVYASGLRRAARGALSAAYELEYLRGLESQAPSGPTQRSETRLRRT